MTSADGKPSPARTRATAAGTSVTRRRPSPSMRKKEKASGTGAGTGLPARRSASSVSRSVAREVGGFRGRREKELGRRRTRRRRQRLEHEERVGFHEVEQRLDERLAVERAGSASPRERFEHPDGGLVTRPGAKGLDDAADPVRDRQAADGLPVLSVRALEHELLRAFGPRPRRPGDFLQVVVVGQRPEDGRRRHAALRQLAGDVDRVERLHQREDRAGEDSDLVARRDGDGAAGDEVFGQPRRLAAAVAEGGRRHACPRPGGEQLLDRAPPRRRASAGRGRTPGAPGESRRRAERGPGTSRRESLGPPGLAREYDQSRRIGADRGSRRSRPTSPRS